MTTVEQARRDLAELQRYQHDIRAVVRGLAGIAKLEPFLNGMISGTNGVVELASTRDALSEEVKQLKADKAQAESDLATARERADEAMAEAMAKAKAKLAQLNEEIAALEKRGAAAAADAEAAEAHHAKVRETLEGAKAALENVGR